MFNFPLSDEDLVKYVDNVSGEYDIQYKSGLFEMGIPYLSNLEIKCNLLFENSKDKLEFIKCYMTSDNLCRIINIESMVIKIILRSINIELDNFNPDISDEDIAKFISENSDLIDKYKIFLNSLVLYAYSTFKKNCDKPTFDGIECVDDINYIGVNIVNLFKYEELYFYYLNPNITTVKNFKRQFNDYMFNGLNLYHYFFNDNNRLEQFMLCL